MLIARINKDSSDSPSAQLEKSKSSRSNFNSNFVASPSTNERFKTRASHSNSLKAQRNAQYYNRVHQPDQIQNKSSATSAMGTSNV